MKRQSMAGPSWYRFDGGQARHEIAGLTLEETAAHFSLFAEAASSPTCELPGDDETLAELARVPFERIGPIVERLISRGHWKRTKSGLRHQNLYRQFLSYRQFSTTASEAGKRGAAKRWKNNDLDGVPHGYPNSLPIAKTRQTDKTDETDGRNGTDGTDETYGADETDGRTTRSGIPVSSTVVAAPEEASSRTTPLKPDSLPSSSHPSGPQPVDLVERTTREFKIGVIIHRALTSAGRKDVQVDQRLGAELNEAAGNLSLDQIEAAIQTAVSKTPSVIATGAWFLPVLREAARNAGAELKQRGGAA